MKITEMLRREDFYQINRDTLAAYYGGKGREETLYIYPRLNAIVIGKPSRAVKDYLLTEYDVQGDAARRLAVKAYVWLCLSSMGMLADRKISLPNTATGDTLIYPCNRKYRIFDFAAQTVDVQIKAGFPTEQLRHEIEFRTRKNLPTFVPAIVSHSELGYKEQIINGKPLARITEGFESLAKAAYTELQAYAKQFTEQMSGEAYAARLQQGMNDTNADCAELAEKLCAVIRKVPDVEITFSHGDLQAGNIWIENGTPKVFIIDWESWGMRSVFYDKATLFDGLRPGDISHYLSVNIPVAEKAIVLMEDLKFQLDEYRSLPGDFGRNKLKEYVRKVTEWAFQALCS